MVSSTSKIKKYIQEYITKDKWLRSLMLPALLALVGYNFFEMMTFRSMGTMGDPKDKNEDMYGEGFNYCIYYFLAYSLVFLYEIFNAYFVAISLKNGIINFFKEFLIVSYKTFTSIGLGEAQYCINRRVFSLVEFLESICLDFVSNLFFFFISLHSLNKAITDTNLKFKIFICIVVFILVSCGIQYLRSLMRYRVNLGFDKSSRKLYDILYNYERIVSYDNLDYELKKYEESMDDQVFYCIIFWVSFEVVQFLNFLFFLGVNVYFLSVLGLKKNPSINLRSIYLVFDKIKGKVMNMIDSIDSLANNFVNLDQSLIENCPLDENEDGLYTKLSGDEIFVENLSFIYDTKLVFKNITTKMKRGEKIAIAGSNGSGKSTFVKILEGLYDYGGTIEIDSIDYKKLSKKSIRDAIAYVPQNSYLFDDTLHENLKKGNFNITDEKIIEYAKIYNFHEVFKEIGYNKRVGERGKYLSGGQRQKISFLRAAIKNAPILILDEATSNMDQISEQDVINKIKNNMKNTTVIMIVHNLEKLKEFDKILYFGGDENFEEGGFEELMDKKGLFYDFYNNSIKENT